RREAGAEWVISAEPTPGEPNLIPEATATGIPLVQTNVTETREPTATRTPTATREPTATRTPTVTRTPTATKMPTATRVPTATKTPTVTKTPSALPSALPTPWPAGSIVISALLPAPVTGESEWVEVTSYYASPINLRDWFLSDASGQRRSLAEQELAPGETVRILMTRALLNNGGDTVMLHDPLGTVIDTFTYTATTVGQIIWRRSEAAASPPSSAQPGADPPLHAVVVTGPVLTPVVPQPLAEPRPASLLPQSPAAAYLSATLPLPTPTRSPIAEADCADCAQAAWPWSRMAAAALGVIALLLFVAEPTPAKASQRD
ncbi:lamin tail domain-containing protein, partial [Chloroflexus sp.]|uniref:lamin tail domain-containing protein n=1 Tax=Chloroflexus sp. TaxID=1904827 RepID=UPI002ACD6FFE